MSATYATLDDLLTAMRAGQRDTLDAHGDQYRTDLPTFGGGLSADTYGAWSWDRTRVLVGTCTHDLEIVARDAWEAAR